MASIFPIVCNQVVTVLLGLLGAKLISAFVPKATYGYYANFLTLTQLGVMVTHSGILNHAMRYWQREKPQTGGYSRFVWTVSWRGLSTLGPLLFLVSAAVAFWEGDFAWVWVLPWLLFGSMAVVWSAIATSVLNADRKLWDVLVVSLVGTAARTLAPIGLALVAGMTFFNLSAGFALHGLVLLGCLSLFFGRMFQAPSPTPDQARQWKQELKDYGRPFALLGIGAWLLQSVDRWVVWLFFGEAQAGLFAYAFALGAIIPTFTVGAVMQRVFPDVFKKADQARTSLEWRQIAQRCDHVTALFLVVTVAGLVVLQAAGPLLMGWLISSEYAPSIEMLVPAGFAMVAAQVNQFYYLLLQGQHNSAGMVKVMTTVAGVKSAGSLIAAAISWPVFLGWLIVSTVVSGLIGRQLIRKMALERTEYGPTG